MSWPITIAAGTTIPASWYPAVSNGMQHWQGQVDANGQNLVNVTTLAAAKLSLSDPVALKFTGSDFKYTECESAHLAFTKKRGSYNYYWRITDDGLRAGANNFQAMELTDIGDLNLGGHITESTGLGVYAGRPAPYGDLNNASVNGFWDVDSTTANKPSGCSTYGSALTANHASNTRAQLCMSAQPGAANAMWIRHSASWGDSTSWEPWSQFAIQGQDVMFTRVLGSNVDGDYLRIGHQNWAGSYYAAFGGVVTDGGGNTCGRIRLSTRRSTADAALTLAMEIFESGLVSIPGRLSVERVSRRTQNNAAAIAAGLEAGSLYVVAGDPAHLAIVT